MTDREKMSGKAGSGLLFVILMIITALAAGCLIVMRYRTMKNETVAPSVTAPPAEEPVPTPEPTPTPVPTPSPEEIAAQEEAARREAAARKAEAAKYSFYQKLKKGYDTNILVLGDASAADPAGDRVNGIVDGPKFSGLSKVLEEKYPSKVTITNLAFPAGSLLGDAIRVLEMPEEPSYDLIILSYGLNDQKENKEANIFGHVEPNQNLWPDYMALLLTLSNKFPDCSIVCTLEPCFHEITEELDGMRRISEAYYGIPVIDLVTALHEKGDGSDLAFFEADQTTLNEKGMEEWIRLLRELIDTKAEESAEKMARIVTGYDKANGVSKLSFIPAADPRVSRRDDTSYTLDIKAEGISFIRHKKQLGREDLKVIADDMLYNFGKTGGIETPEGSYIILLHEQLLCEKSFEIIFADKELADGLEGFYLIEKKAEME